MTTKNTKTEDDGALAKLVEASKATRLSPEQEKEAAGLVKASLSGSKAGIISAVDSMVDLPWVVGVDSIVELWPGLKALARKNLLAALVAQQTEQGRRFRLSLGRGIFTLDAETARKLIQTVCVEMAIGENGMLTQNDRQIFANVLIGKDKPWLLRLPVAEIDGAEADAIIRCAVAACFSRQCPPLTQLFLLRWISSAGKLIKLPDDLLDLIAKSIKRWHPKLQDQFKTDIPEVPPLIEEALKKSPVQQPQSQPQPQAERREHPQAERHERPQPKPAPERHEKKHQSPASTTKASNAAFDLSATLRHIEAHVQSLRSELNETKNELRQRRQPSRDQGRRRGPVETIGSDTTDVAELQRHNQQLEETVTELRKHLEELAADHEDIATSMQAHDEIPLGEGKEQLLALLGIKLREDFAEFQNLAKEPPDEVFREHYRMLLEDVFNVLEKQGVVFDRH